MHAVQPGSRASDLLEARRAVQALDELAERVRLPAGVFTMSVRPGPR